MQQPMISIIIPMYNEENNIKTCIESLRSQTSQNFHVVFINDGSTDDTVQKLLKLLANNPPFFSYEIINQKNMGAAKAREVGIEKSTTPYVMILDCDDKISKDSIATNTHCISKSLDVDILIPNAKIESTSGYTNFVFYNNAKNLKGIECLQHSFGQWQVHGWFCAKRDIFLKSYSTYKKFNTREGNYINNDEVITRLNFYYSNKVIRTDAIYYYQNNLQSTTKKINYNRYLLCKNAIILYKLFGQGMGDISLNARKELIDIAWGTYGYLKRNKNKLPNKPDWINEIKNTIKYILSQKNFSLTFKEKVKLYRRYISINFI